MAQVITDDDISIEDIEIQLLLEAIYLRYGYDFRRYTKASLRRRLSYRLQASKLDTFSQMTEKLLHDRSFFHHC